MDSGGRLSLYDISVAFQLWNSLLIAFLAALPIKKYSVGLLGVKAGYWNDKFGLFYWLDAFRVQEKCIKGLGEKDNAMLFCVFVTSSKHIVVKVSREKWFDI